MGGNLSSNRKEMTQEEIKEEIKLIENILCENISSYQMMVAEERLEELKKLT